MREITLEELLEAGCHFGHQVNRQNPKAREFIFEARNNVHIIDLAKTKEGLEVAASFIKEQASQGKTIVFVGTKRQAKNIIKTQAKRAGVFYVDERWVGGTLTNFEEIAKNFKKLKELREKLTNKEEIAKYTKREVGLWRKEIKTLERFYGGIEGLEKVPDAMFIVDTHLEEGAVAEAGKMGLITIGIVDTNANPAIIDYPIPANDDAVGSVELITHYIADAWVEGQKERESRIRNQESKEKEKNQSEKTEKKLKTVKNKRATKVKKP